MRILHTVQLYEPHVGGSEEVVKQLSERLAWRGHEVTVATAADPAREFRELNGVRIEEFEVSGNAATGITGEADRYIGFLKAFPRDVMMNYAAQIWSTDLALYALDEIPGAKVIVPCGYSGLMWPQFAQYFAYLWQALARYDAQVHLSPDYRDARYARLYELTNGVVIPNAAPEEEFERPTAGFREAYGITTGKLVLCVANHYEGKGHDALIAAFKEAAPPDTTLAIVGREMPGGCYARCRRAAEGAPIVLATDVPRELTVAAYHEADLFVLASDVECFPLVLLEAMASRTAWISTDVGNARELAGGVVVEREGIGACMGELLADDARRAELAEAGRREWEAHFTWERVVDQYEALYAEVAERHAHG